MSNYKKIKLVKSRVRVGRGRSSGHGKTSGRGMSGQRSRTGATTKFFEGGQTKLTQRLPKAGGFRPHKKYTLEITTEKIENNFKDVERVDSKELIKKFGRGKKYRRLKIIRSSNLTKIINFADDLMLSKSLK